VEGSAEQPLAGAASSERMGDRSYNLVVVGMIVISPLSMRNAAVDWR
jgi:hypothetical protein